MRRLGSCAEALRYGGAEFIRDRRRYLHCSVNAYLVQQKFLNFTDHPALLGTFLTGASSQGARSFHVFGHVPPILAAANIQPAHGEVLVSYQIQLEQRL